MRNSRVAVLGGGHPSEHEVSLRSSTSMARALVAGGRRVVPAIIAEDGTWHVLKELSSADVNFSFPTRVAGGEVDSAFSGGATRGVEHLKDLDVDVVVLGLHGRGGEDGTIQGFLTVADLPFTGSGVAASAFGVDKVRCKCLLEAVGLRTPHYREYRRDDWSADSGAGEESLEAIVQEMDFPLVVKPVSLGSSVGVHVVADESEVEPAVRSALELDGRILVEEFIQGREFTCATLGSRTEPETFPVVEVVPKKASWFDLASKYDPEGADEIVPADTSPELERTLRRLAAQVHSLIGADGASRTDFILDPYGKAWILEINTLPGMSEGSLYPKALRAAGWSLEDLMERLVEDALRKASDAPETA